MYDEIVAAPDEPSLPVAVIATDATFDVASSAVTLIVKLFVFVSVTSILVTFGITVSICTVSCAWSEVLFQSSVSQASTV